MNTTTTANPIADAVSPLKNDAMNRAEEYALAVVERVRKELEANGNDLEKVAPYPSGNKQPQDVSDDDCEAQSVHVSVRASRRRSHVQST